MLPYLARKLLSAEKSKVNIGDWEKSNYSLIKLYKISSAI